MVVIVWRVRKRAFSVGGGLVWGRDENEGGRGRGREGW